MLPLQGVTEQMPFLVFNGCEMGLTCKDVYIQADDCTTLCKC